MKTLLSFLVSMFLVSCNGGGGGSSSSGSSNKANPTTPVQTTNHYAYVANFGDDTIEVKRVNSTSRELNQVEIVNTCDRPNMLAIHPDETFLYVTCSGDDSVIVYSINQNSGVLTEVEEQTSVGTYPHGIAVSGDGDFLVVANESDAEIASFSIANDGTLTAVDTIASAVNDGSYGAPHDVKIIGDYVYVANYSSLANNIGVFRLNSDGTFTLVERESSGSNPRVLYSLGNHLLAVNRGSDDVSIFTRSPITGELTAVETESVGDSPTSATSVGSFVYVSNSADDSITVFSYNSSTGDLTLVGTSSVGDKPIHLIGISALDTVVSLNEDGSNIENYEKLGDGTLGVAPESSGVGTTPSHGVYVSITN